MTCCDGPKCRLEPGDPRHGGAGTAYDYWGCRCPECRAAHAERVARRRHDRAGEAAPVHGVRTTYTNWGCRCPACRDTQRVYSAEYRKRRSAS